MTGGQWTVEVMMYDKPDDLAEIILYETMSTRVRHSGLIQSAKESNQWVLRRRKIYTLIYYFLKIMYIIFMILLT